MGSLVKSNATFLLGNPQVKTFENWFQLVCAEETFSHVDKEYMEGTSVALEEQVVISRYQHNHIFIFLGKYINIFSQETFLRPESVITVSRNIHKSGPAGFVHCIKFQP